MKTDVVLYQSGRFRPTNFFVSVNLILLLSRLTHYGAINDNKSIENPAISLKIATYIAV